MQGRNSAVTFGGRVYGTSSWIAVADGKEQLAVGISKEIADSMGYTPKYDNCMSVYVDEEGGMVELRLDTSIETYSEWIEGESADSSLIRCRKTGRVVGIEIPLRRNNLCVYHEGPIRINAGFRISDADVDESEDDGIDSDGVDAIIRNMLRDVHG